MRRGNGIPTFGLSFLDLICCALAGVIVLYVIAPPRADADAPGQNLTVIQVEADREVNNIGLRIELADGPAASWEEDGLVTWVRSPRSLTAFVSEPLAGDAGIDILILDSGTSVPDMIRVRVSRMPIGTDCNVELKKSVLYRYRIDDASGQC